MFLDAAMLRELGILLGSLFPDDEAWHLCAHFECLGVLGTSE